MNIFKKSVDRGTNRRISKNSRNDNSSIGKTRVIYAIIILILIYMIFAFLYNLNKKNFAIDVSNMGVSNKTSKSQSPSRNDFYTVKQVSQNINSTGGAIYIPNTINESLNKYISINIDEYISGLV